MTVLHFVIPGPPRPAQRARVFQRKGTNAISSAIPRETREYQNRLRIHAMAAVAANRWRPGRGPYALEMDVYRERAVGDWDNHGKNSDAFTGVIWEDDRYVVDAHVRLFIDRERPRVEVTVRVLEGS